jgi:glycosyltransferase involved in cell wall biosynthesis
MSTIIIPAHNESGVIANTLESLLQQAEDDDEIFVISNGCIDETEAIARSYEPRITVINSPIPSKVNALNLGDQCARTYPRIYMDADIKLADGALGAIKKTLAAGNYLAVSPEPIMDFGRSSWAVKAYYYIWLSMPFCKSGMIGAGVYALSEEGRKRFDHFPDVIADDGFVRALFKEHERGKAIGAKAIVRAPATLYWLMKIKVRSRMGQMQLASMFPELIKNERKNLPEGISNTLIKPLNWPKVIIYLYISVASRIQAHRRMVNIAAYQWEQDISSRKYDKNLRKQ